MCNKINQNLEILKFIVYLILKSHDSLRKITTKTGKSFSLVQKIGKEFDLSICPLTNSFYIRAYDERFKKKCSL